MWIGAYSLTFAGGLGSGMRLLVPAADGSDRVIDFTDSLSSPNRVVVHRNLLSVKRWTDGPKVPMSLL
jgi:hypothetical protein